MFNEVWQWAGRYRTSDKNIGDPWLQIPVKVHELCDDVRYWVEHGTYAGTNSVRVSTTGWSRFIRSPTAMAGMPG
jgi:fido (protein-threonine AMPylation protein)